MLVDVCWLYPRSRCSWLPPVSSLRPSQPPKLPRRASPTLSPLTFPRPPATLTTTSSHSPGPRNIATAIPTPSSVVAIIRDLSCMACGRSSTMVNGPRPVPASLDYRIPPACSTSCPTPVSSSMSGPRTAPVRPHRGSIFRRHPQSLELHQDSAIAGQSQPHHHPQRRSDQANVYRRQSRNVFRRYCRQLSQSLSFRRRILPRQKSAAHCLQGRARLHRQLHPDSRRPIGPSALQSVATSARLEFPESRTPVFNASSLPIPARPIVSTVR